jgi:DNA-3-methyladenine glycosylase
MWGMPGSSFVYMVHGQWLFNVVTERVGKAGAVLIRALEPLTGIELMRRRRGVVDERALTSGPGRLTQAMGITRADHLLDLTDPKSHLRILAGPRGRFRIARSHRIGVSQDLPEKLRFFISGNLYVSR